MNELEWDKKLKIRTCGRDDSRADEHHHPYEPTPYCVLQRLADSGYIKKENILVDYGCGKGRVGFFLNHEIGCHTIGVEYDETIFAQAVENLESYSDPSESRKNLKSHKKSMESFGKDLHITFFCENAETFEIRNADSFYFFNPFTARILRSVMRRIVSSYYENPSQMRLFFYYPDNEYIGFLLTGDKSGLMDQVSFLDEIDCSDLFPGADSRERIMVFELEG